MSWRHESERHSMASRGIRTVEHKLVANGEKKCDARDPHEIHYEDGNYIFVDGHTHKEKIVDDGYDCVYDILIKEGWKPEEAEEEEAEEIMNQMDELGTCEF